MCLVLIAKYCTSFFVKPCYVYCFQEKNNNKTLSCSLSPFTLALEVYF